MDNNSTLDMVSGLILMLLLAAIFLLYLCWPGGGEDE